MDIIYEDKALIVVNKPPNLLVHHSHYARNIHEESLVQQLRGYLGAKVFPVHRLDRKTSGLLVFAKSAEIANSLQSQFEAQLVQKVYFALVRGFVSESGNIDQPVKHAERGIYQDAVTYYQPIEQIEADFAVAPYATARYTLLKLSPKTGRMHQLRKHMNKFSHPIIGDPKYGNRHHNHAFIDRFGVSNLFLHAGFLQLEHPETEEKVEFQSDFPEFWQEVLSKLGFKTDLQNLLVAIKDRGIDKF